MARTVVGVGGGPRQRVRAGGPGEVVEAQAELDGAPDPVGLAHPPGHPVDDADEHRVDVGRRSRARDPRARCEPIERRRRPTCTGEGRGCGPRRGGGARTPGRASRPAQPSSSRATSPTVRDAPRTRSFSAVTGPTPHSRSTGRGCRNASSPSGRDHEQPVGLGHGAGHLGQELRAGHPDGDGQADPLADGSRAARVAICDGRPGDPAAGRRRRGRPRRSTAPRPAAWCPRRRRTPPCWPRCRPPSGAGRRRPTGRAGGPARRPWRCGSRRPCAS